MAKIPFPSLKIGRILGISIEINYTWFVIFALVTSSLAFSYFPALYPRHSMLINILDGLITALFFFLSVIAHELSHSYVARLNQVPIQKITLFIFGGVAEMSSEPKSSAAEFKMAIAGPLASFVLSGLFFLVYLAAGLLRLSSPITAPLFWLSGTNLFLGLFNLLPGFPLDGGRILRAVLWKILKDFRRATKIAVRGGQTLTFMLIAVGLWEILFQRRLDGAWLVFLGWFLNYIASAYYQRATLEQSLSNVKVSEIMMPNVLTVSPDLSLESLVNDYFLKYRFGRFPVVDGSELLGAISLHDVKEIPREKWPETRVREAMAPLKPSLIVQPESEVVEVLMQMALEEVGHLLVVKEGTLIGIVTKSDVLRLIRAKSELGI